ncbi:MAG: MFS transporter [Chloroflexota bacterium]|nr:MFS transporter [Chloroflexota bacterium]
MRSRQVRASLLEIRVFGIELGSIGWLLAMSTMLFVLLFPFSSYVAALPIIQEEWGLNNTQAGAIFSAYLAGFAVSALVVVPLTDRLGSKRVFVASTSISVVANVLFPLVANDAITASILRALAGLGLVGVYNPGMRIVAERFADRGRGFAVGTFVTFFYASNSVSLTLTGILLAWFEWRDAYLIMSAASGASVVMAFLVLRNHKSQSVSGSSGRLDISVLKNKAARIYITGYSLHAAELYIVRVWLPALLAAALIARGEDELNAAVGAATIGGLAMASGAIGPVMGGTMSDRFGRAASASVIFVLSGVCAVAVGWMVGLPLPLIIGVSIVLGWAIAADSAIYSTAVTEVAEPTRLGSTMAVHSFVGFMGGVVGPVLAGAVLDVSPESLKWGLTFSATGLLAIVAIIAMRGMWRLPTMPSPGSSSD